MEPISLSVAIISLIGTIAIAILNLFKDPPTCYHGFKSDCMKSSCCVIEGDLSIQN
jgi:hypothetical protein